MDIRVRDKGIEIVRNGETKKFVEKVDQVTVSGEYALKIGQPVTVITERAVFKLTKKGLMLTEVAPNVDLDKHILSQMEFKPIIPKELKEMPQEIFADELLNLKERPPWSYTSQFE
jgi:propionate CoA-transferase